MNTTTHQRGATLIEALVALLVLSVSVMSATRLQTWLQSNADLARERSTAVRLAQQALEQVRQAPSLTAYDGISTESNERVEGNTTYALDRGVTDAHDLKTLAARIAWRHRGAGNEHLQLVSATPRLSPVYTAALELPSQDHTLAVRQRLPAGAQIGIEGQAVLRPSASSTIAWLIDRATGHITAVCHATGTASRPNANNCEALQARLVQGFVRFALSATPDPLQGRDAPLPMTLHAGATRCISETVITPVDRYIAYWCAVPPAQADEPTLQPQGWSFGLDPAHYKACRYPSAPNAWRNYLVIHGDLACPAVQTPHNGAPVVTVQHQP